MKALKNILAVLALLTISIVVCAFLLQPLTNESLNALWNAGLRLQYYAVWVDCIILMVAVCLGYFILLSKFIEDD